MMSRTVRETFDVSVVVVPTCFSRAGAAVVVAIFVVFIIFVTVYFLPDIIFVFVACVQ